MRGKEVKKGKVCRVLSDTLGNFSTRELVVVLEDHPVPYCCQLTKYDPKKPLYKYSHKTIHPLYCYELEVLYDWSER